jgi:RNA polymerase sigma-70 factor (ECF subfamily)
VLADAICYKDVMPDDDITLVRRTLAGDKQAFDQLVRRTTPHVLSIIRRFFSERHSMEDVAQEVYVSAYLGLKTYRQDRPFKNWLAAITVRQCYKALQAKKKNKQILESEMGFEASAALDVFWFGRWGTETTHAEQKAMRKNVVEQILQRLAPKERMILVLTEVEGLSIREVANMLGLSQINIKVSGFRARKNALKIFKRLARAQAFKKASKGDAHE